MDYKKIIVQWKEFNLPIVMPREIEIDLDVDFIWSITGPRRAGKTYFCFQIINNLLKRGVNKKNILYINFEDEKLLGASVFDMEKLLETFFELIQINEKQNIYLFFDEIQNVSNWDIWTRRIYDTQKNIKLIITGSSSRLLSKEISTKLRGRVINKEVYPLSFKEFLQWKNVDYDLKTLLYSKNRFLIKQLFYKYLMNGGYPALFNSDTLGDKILQSYYESMIFRDIIERYNIKEIKKLKILASLLFESVSKDIAYNRLANRLKSMGFHISKNTIIEYISYFEDAYLFFQNLKYEYSLTKQIGSIKKIYCIDNGLLNSVSFKFSDDIGNIMENLVFIELKRQNKIIYYHRNKYDCDFIITQKNRIVSAFQVSEKITEYNEKREINGLLEAMTCYKINNGTLLTAEQYEEKTINKKKIKIIPVWLWLLDKK